MQTISRPARHPVELAHLPSLSLRAVIAFRTYPREEIDVYVIFLNIVGQWVRIGPDGVLPLD
jgi:hypothetical protein